MYIRRDRYSERREKIGGTGIDRHQKGEVRVGVGYIWVRRGTVACCKGKKGRGVAEEETTEGVKE